jgi:hypothetical protein
MLQDASKSVYNYYLHELFYLCCKIGHESKNVLKQRLYFKLI